MPCSPPALMKSLTSSSSALRSAADLHRSTGRPSLSPRRSYGTPDRPPIQPLSLGELIRHWPSLNDVVELERAGNEPSTSPGTATTSHSSPLAACTVNTWTASADTSMYPLSS